MIPIGDAIGKHIQVISDYTPVLVSWWRFLLGAVVVLPWVILTHQLPPPTKTHKTFWIRQFVRGTLIAATVTLIVTAVGLSPLPDVFGAFFIGPGISVILAQLLLRVRVTKLDWLAVVLGFLGVLMVVQPTGTISPGIPWALASGCCYGAFLVATRWAAETGPPMAQVAAQFSIAALCLTPFALPAFLALGIQAPGWVIASAALSTSANLLSVIALARAGNAVLAPVVYLQVVAATIVGVTWFGDVPNLLTTLGLLLIVATGAMRAMVFRQT